MNRKISLSIIRDNNILPIRFKTRFAMGRFAITPIPFSLASLIEPSRSIWSQMFIDIPIIWLQTDYKNGINYCRLKLNESNNLVVETWKWNMNNPDKEPIMECYIE